jgi:hypothetical protein
MEEAKKEGGVEVPFEKLAMRPVALPVQQRDQLPCLRVADRAYVGGLQGRL